MAWINIHYSTCFFLVYFGYYVTVLPIYGETLSAPPHFQVVNISSLLPNPYCEASLSGPTFGLQKLKIISRLGPCSSSASRTKTPSSDELLNWDQARVRSINKRANYGNNLSEDENFEGYDHGEYTIKIGLGTPRKDYNLIVDTGSPGTWVRCQSCTEGCKSNDPLYDPSKSSTYTNSTSCNGPFSVSYHDGTSAKGIWGCDALTIDGFGAIKNFRFGCAQEIVDDTDDNFNGAAGILGLSKGEYSLLSQSSDSNPKLMQMFSYCMPIKSSSIGNLYFGDEAKKQSSNSPIKFTPLVDGANKDTYYLGLVGISVAGKKLNVSQAIFTDAGTIIDSGTAITRLPQVVYSTLRDAFRKLMSNYTPSKYEGLMDTCYKIEDNMENQVGLPEITLHFEKGTDVTLSKFGIFWFPSDRKVMCLAFAATDSYTDASIIGNIQQRGLNVVYDLKGRRIGFGQC